MKVVTLDTNGPKALAAGSAELAVTVDQRLADYDAAIQKLAAPESFTKYTPVHLDELRGIAKQAAFDALWALKPKRDRMGEGLSANTKAWGNQFETQTANARFTQTPSGADGVMAQLLEQSTRAEMRAEVKDASDEELAQMVADAVASENLALLGLLAKEIPRRPLSATAAKSALIEAKNSVSVAGADVVEEQLAQVARDLRYFDAAVELIRTGHKDSAIDYRRYQVRDAAEKVDAAAAA